MSLECHPPPSPPPAPVRTRGLVPPSLGAPPKHLSKHFRHASYGFSGDGGAASWHLPPAVDWRQKRVLAGVKDQGHCEACWAFAAVGAIEAASAILLSRQVAASEQQVIDCQRGSSSCAGGWPGDALEYAAGNTARYGGLAPEAGYPYRGAKSATGCDAKKVDFLGVLGLLLAVQRQPVVVSLEADQDSFINYSGKGVYDDPACFSNALVDHAVLLVGYNLTAKTPHLIIRNSWGRGWGDGGYMYLAIAGGDGVCGVTSTPGMYPIAKGEWQPPPGARCLEVKGSVQAAQVAFAVRTCVQTTHVMQRLPVYVQASVGVGARPLTF
eukprot:jgi/Mesen1/5164/ME000256S04350